MSTVKIRTTCGKRASDVRSFWLLGLQGVELKRAQACRRPKGHRGSCRHYVTMPPPPLRLPEVTEAALRIDTALNLGELVP